MKEDGRRISTLGMRISDLSRHLGLVREVSRFGWIAVPVSGIAVDRFLVCFTVVSNYLLSNF